MKVLTNKFHLDLHLKMGLILDHNEISNAIRDAAHIKRKVDWTSRSKQKYDDNIDDQVNSVKKVSDKFFI